MSSAAGQMLMRETLERLGLATLLSGALGVGWARRPRAR